MKFIKILYFGNDIQIVNQQQVITLLVTYNLRPRRPPFLLVESEGIGVTSSIRPIFMAERANARRADCAPGPGVFVLFPPVARSLMCRAVIPRDLHFSATSCMKKIKFGKICFEWRKSTDWAHMRTMCWWSIKGMKKIMQWKTVKFLHGSAE